MTRRKIQLLAAALFLLASAVAFDRYQRAFIAMEGGGAPVAILVANQDLNYGVALRREFLAIRVVPSAYVDSRNLRADDVQQIIGISLASSLRAGQAVLQNDLNIYALSRRALSSNIPSGYRALSVQADNLRSFGGLIRPGDRLDIAIRNDDQNSAQERILLSNIAVLAMGEELERSSNQDRPRTRTNVTLMVTPEQSALLAHALRGYSLHFFLRNPADAVLERGSVVRLSTLFSATERARYQTTHQLADPAALRETDASETPSAPESNPI